MINKPPERSTRELMLAWENGEIGWDKIHPDREMIILFRRLIDSGDAWRLQGYYGRQAARLIEAGYCRLRDTPKSDT